MKKIVNYKKDAKILLVEDDTITRKKVISILSKSYSNIIEAENGEIALELYRQTLLSGDVKFDLIISDINMPLTNGIELLESIREMDTSIPFIFITAKTDLEYILHVIKLDINDYILKPINIDMLLQSIDNTLMKSYKREFTEIRSNTVRLLNDFYWNISEHSLSHNNEIIKLTKNEIIILDLLCNQVNKIVNSEYIIYSVWVYSLDMESANANLKNLISRLRYKHPLLEIENIYGLGYRIKGKNEFL